MTPSLSDLSKLSQKQDSSLRDLLSRLSYPVAAKLLGAIEKDRLTGGEDLPHDLLIGYIRPSVATNEPPAPRVPLPQRVFCQPFEDLLHIGRLPQKEFGRISRDVLNPLWTWLNTELMRDQMTVFADEIRSVILIADGADYRHPSVLDLHRKAAKAIKAALARAESDKGEAKRIAKLLGGPEAMDDVAEIAEIIEYGFEIMEVQLRYPRPVEHLTNEDLFDFRRFFNSFTDNMPAMVPYLLLIMMGRLARPWEMLGVLAFITRSEDDAKVADSSDVGVVGDSLLRDVERFSRHFETDDATTRPAKEMIVSLEQFTELVQGMTKEMGIRKDGEWGQRIFRCRKVVSDAMERQLDNAVKRIDAALAVRGGAAATAIASPRPDLSESPQESVIADAIDAATLIAGVKSAAAKAAFTAAQSSAAQKAGEAVRQYADDLIEEIRAAESEDRDVAQETMREVMKVVDILIEDDDAERLRRRAASAATAA